MEKTALTRHHALSACRYVPLNKPAIVIKHSQKGISYLRIISISNLSSRFSLLQKGEKIYSKKGYHLTTMCLCKARERYYILLLVHIIKKKHLICRRRRRRYSYVRVAELSIYWKYWQVNFSMRTPRLLTKRNPVGKSLFVASPALRVLLVSLLHAVLAAYLLACRLLVHQVEAALHRDFVVVAISYPANFLIWSKLRCYKILATCVPPLSLLGVVKLADAGDAAKAGRNYFLNTYTDPLFH